MFDPNVYIGAPACVIGDGTAAAEAVIAISTAKHKAEDPSGVYWSYSHDTIPGLPEAVSDRLAVASSAHRNVHELPASEPTTVVELDGTAYLRVRTFRTVTKDKPTVTTELEFNRAFCVACIDTSSARPAARTTSHGEMSIPSAPQRASECRLVSVAATGVQGQEFPIVMTGVTTIGRKSTIITFANDQSLADHHASIERRAEGYFIRDEDSTQGVFVQLGDGRVATVPFGTYLRAGRQWLVVSRSNNAPVLIHYSAEGKELSRYALGDTSVIVGRQSPNVTIVPTDGSLSRRHFVASVAGTMVRIKDLGSANGTFVKVNTPFLLAHGDRIHVGQQVLQFVEQRGSSEVEPLPAADPARAKSAIDGEGPSVLFAGTQGKIPCQAGQTICEVAADAGIKMDADCRKGSCGMDPVKILRGGENLTPPTGKERDTLEDLCALVPGPYRLACVAKVNGPVEIEIVKQ
jgi:ferredoxin